MWEKNPGHLQKNTGIGFSHNNLGLVSGISDASGSRSLTYTAALPGKETWSSGELNGFEVERTYDARFRMNGVTVRQGAQVIYSVNYGYEGDRPELDKVTYGNRVIDFDRVPGSGLLEQTTFKTGGITRLTVHRERDAHNRIETLTTDTADTPSAFLSDLSYGDDGRIERIGLAGGDFWEIDYQGDGQLNTAVLKSGVGGTVYPGYDFDYAFSAMRHRTGLVLNSSAAQTHTGTANILNQVTGRTVPGAVEVSGEAHPAAAIRIFSADVLTPVAYAGTWAAAGGYLSDGNADKGRKWEKGSALDNLCFCKVLNDSAIWF
ncbi:MAG: hypothetical protein LAT79_18365 [Kiritimatiellae bacterium]|nr:hypothetical protein [Kiritimatiellia bacterium]